MSPTRNRVPSMEALESRTLLAAPTAAIVNMWAEPTFLVMVVDWTDADAATLGNNDFQMNQVGRPLINGVKITNPTVVDGKLRITYVFDAYDRAWGVTDTGSYQWTSPVGNVLSPQGETVADPLVHTRDLWFGAPKAHFVGQEFRGTDWLVVVQYDTLNGLDTSTVNGANMKTGGTNTTISVQSIVPWGPTSTRVVYKVQPTAGVWTHLDNGRYFINMGYTEPVKDLGGRTQTYSYDPQPFSLWFPSPSATVRGTTMNENDWIIPVWYRTRGTHTINVASIAAGGAAVKVVGPGGFEQEGILTDTFDSSGVFGSGIIAYYRIPAKGGAWDYRDNGAYTLKQIANEVSDSAGYSLQAQDLQTFNLWFSTPTAEILAPSTPAADQWDLNIRFRDDTQINAATITAGSIRVVGPGDVELVFSLISVGGTSPSFSHTALFRAVPVGAAFANGEYRVYLNRDGVRDAAGRTAGETLLGTFNINF